MPQKEEPTPRNLYQVEKFAARYPDAWTAAAIRAFILNAEDRINSRGERIPGNGLAEAGAIVRVGRRVLIDEGAWFKWLAQQQKQRRRPAA
jgi:hypothetical protein